MKPAIDTHELLERVSGNREFANLMLDTFFSSSDERITMMHQYLEQEDYDNLADDAHKMKGVVGNLAIHQTYELLKDLHREARLKNNKKAARLIKLIDDSIEAAKKYYQSITL